MKTLYTDAAFDYRHNDKSKDPFVRGKIAVSDGKNFHKVDKVVVGKVPNLKQYINVLELTAIARAVELACDAPEADGSLKIFSDSEVAVAWANSGKVNPKVQTEAHLSALDYLKSSRKLFGGIVTYHHIGRAKNPAGHLLEAENKIEPSYA